MNLMIITMKLKTGKLELNHDKGTTTEILMEAGKNG
jgi:hypothetical protein